jgi:hypothetical protein
MEVISVLLGYDQIHTNIKFVHVPTVPLEDRPGIQCLPPLRTLERLNILPCNRARTLEDVDIAQAIPTCAVQQHLYQETDGRFQQWRTISSFEEITLKDQLFSPITIDSITLFGIRPPELRFVSNPAQYFLWFWRNPSSRVTPTMIRTTLLNVLSTRLTWSEWRDGTNSHILVRSCALVEINNFLDTVTESDFYADEQLQDNLLQDELVTDADGVPNESSAKYHTSRLFQRLLTYITVSPPMTNYGKDFVARFIAPKEQSKLPVIWHNSVNPGIVHRFLLHILLSMGCFTMEAGLLFDGNMKNAFSRARLLTAGISNEANVCAILKRYFITQLVFMPGGSVKFDRYLISAYQALQHVLSGDDVIIDCIPPCLYTKLQQHVLESVKKYVNEQQLSVLQTTLEDLHRKDLQDYHHLSHCKIAHP